MDSANGDSAGEHKGADVCRDFLRKACNRGRMCKYLHPTNAEKKLNFCKDFQNSICRRRSCKFIHCSHEDEEYYYEHGELPPGVDEMGNRGSSSRAPPRQDVSLCRDFLNGKCTRGAKCKFRHESEGDREYERMRSMRGARGGFGDRDDGFDAPRRPDPLDAYRAISRYGRPSAYEGSSSSFLGLDSSNQRHLEEENTRLRQKVELLRKQVDDLTSTNEVLLQQNAQLRTGISVGL